jgi:NAD-dependent dihydropyrimidine dehydrogenase PreA subunit
MSESTFLLRPSALLRREEKPRRSPYRQPPGEHCLAEPAKYFPVIDRNRCEGKGECVNVCPYEVFEVRTIEAEDHDLLSFMGRIRSAVHGRKSAYTPNAASCQACGLCVEACPEDAITLVTFS